MTFSGYLCIPVAFRAGVATWGALGCNLGSGWPTRSATLVDARCRALRPLHFLSHRELDIADRFFERRGSIAVRSLACCRDTHVHRAARRHRAHARLKFHILHLIGRGRGASCCLHRMRLGERWETDPRLKMWFHRLDALILGVIVLAVAYFVWSHVQHRVGRTGVEEAAD